MKISDSDRGNIRKMINNDQISYKIGDIVQLYRKRGKKQYPRFLDFDTNYYIIRIKKYTDSDIYYQVSEDKNNKQVFEIHRSYLVGKDLLRDLKLKNLFDEY